MAKLLKEKPMICAGDPTPHKAGSIPDASRSRCYRSVCCSRVYHLRCCLNSHNNSWCRISGRCWHLCGRQTPPSPQNKINIERSPTEFMRDEKPGIIGELVRELMIYTVRRICWPDSWGHWAVQKGWKVFVIFTFCVTIIVQNVNVTQKTSGVWCVRWLSSCLPLYDIK